MGHKLRKKHPQWYGHVLYECCFDHRRKATARCTWQPRLDRQHRWSCWRCMAPTPGPGMPTDAHPSSMPSELSREWWISEEWNSWGVRSSEWEHSFSKAKAELDQTRSPFRWVTVHMQGVAGAGDKRGLGSPILWRLWSPSDETGSQGHPMRSYWSEIEIWLCRTEGYVDLADRLVELQYELTDRLTFYICGRKPGNWLRLFAFLSCFGLLFLLACFFFGGGGGFWG